MLVFNSFFRTNRSDYGKAVNDFVLRNYGEAVVFADIDQFVNALNLDLLRIHKTFNRHKNILASMERHPIRENHYCITLTNGHNTFLSIEVTNISKAYYYDSKRDSLDVASRGFGVVLEDKD